MTTLDETIRQAVQAYLARTGMSERKLGAFAAGDPALIPRLMAGGSTTLHTADALLRYMDEPPIGPQFASEVEAFLSETGIGERQFGSRAAGDPSFVTKLRNGAGLRLYTVERVRAWMRVNKRALMAELWSGAGETSPAASPDPAARDTRAATTTNPGSSDARPLEGTTPARHDAKALLSTAEAAALLALSASTLKRYRAEGRGPPFLRLGGRVRYSHRRRPASGRSVAARGQGRRSRMRSWVFHFLKAASLPQRPQSDLSFPIEQQGG